MKSKFLLIILLAVLGKLNAQLAKPDTIKTRIGSLVIQPIQHASLVFTINGVTIYVDPSGGADLFKEMPAPGIIIITDIHGDHFDTKTLDAVKPSNTLLIVPQVVADKLPGVNKEKLVVLKNGETTQQAGISIAAIPMYNLPESANAMHTKGRGNGYVLGIGGKNIYIAGDTQGIPEMRSLKNIDIAFVCMNLPYTMNITEAADAVLAFSPKIVYPYHYRGQGGFSDVKAFKDLVAACNKKIEVRLRNWYPVK